MSPTLDAAVCTRKRWTRQECHLSMEAGIEDLWRYELINGDLLLKVDNSTAHTLGLLLAGTQLRRIFGDRHILQAPVIDASPEDTPTSAPEPDLVLLTTSAHDSGAGCIRPSDIRLVIEVSDTTLRSDLSAKGPLYARAGIAEYWVLDLTGRRIFVHRDPLHGIYSHIAIYSAHESIASLANPDAAITVSDFFPPSPQGA